MAQTKRKRRRKHRGTQTGKVDKRGRTTRPRSRAEARSRYKGQVADQRLQPPTWGGAFRKSLLIAGLLVLALWQITDRTLGQAVAVGGFMLFFYVPLGYYTDRFFYSRRAAQRDREIAAKKAQRGKRAGR